MPWVVSYAGQKGGTGKSMLSQAFAVACVKAGDRVVLGDLDIAQRSSLEWGEVRKLNKIEPAVTVMTIDASRRSDFGVSLMPPDVNLLVLDAPGWSDERTLLLAGQSDVMVLPTGASVTDLRPTIRLAQELKARGVLARRIVPALCRVRTDAEIKFARDYLGQSGFSALESVLRDMPDFRNLQNKGYSAVEANGDKMREEAMAMMSSIRGVLLAEQEAQQRRQDRFMAEPQRFDRSLSLTRERE